MRKKPEQILSDRVATYIKEKFPSIPFRFDLSADMPLPPHLAKRGKELHGTKWNKKYPDLFICKCTDKYGGLYLELKAGDTVPNSEHTRGQAMYHMVLRKLGYKAEFCCGFEDCKKKIKKYLKPSSTKK